MTKPLYIIPARGGSKGIPGKNIKPLGGKPLIQWTIDAVRTVETDLERIVLSTDAPEIAAAAERCGLPVPYLRPARLAGDDTPSRDVMLHAMDWADALGIDYDCVVLLQPTSPLRRPCDISNALALYSPEVDMVVSVTPAAANPYYDIFEADSEGMLHVSKGSGRYTRRQDAPEVWQYNGAVYVINPKSLKDKTMGEFTRRVPYSMPANLSIDLDTPLDWAIAEAIIRENAL